MTRAHSNQSHGIAALAMSISLLIASASAAQIYEYDDPSLPASPDGFNITYDASTDTEWLDLTVSEGRTFDDIVGNDGTDELGPGGDYEGFRYASALEVHGWSAAPQIDSLYKSFDINGSFASIAGYPIVRNLMSYIGCSPTSNCANLGMIQGVCVDDATESVPRWGMAQATISQGYNFGAVGGCVNSSPLVSHSSNNSSASYGHFLIRVPEPDAILQLATGTIMLTLVAARRQRQPV